MTPLYCVIHDHRFQLALSPVCPASVNGWTPCLRPHCRYGTCDFRGPAFWVCADRGDSDGLEGMVCFRRFCVTNIVGPGLPVCWSRVRGSSVGVLKRNIRSLFLFIVVAMLYPVSQLVNLFAILSIRETSIGSVLLAPLDALKVSLPNYVVPLDYPVPLAPPLAPRPPRGLLGALAVYQPRYIACLPLLCPVVVLSCCVSFVITSAPAVVTPVPFDLAVSSSTLPDVFPQPVPSCRSRVRAN